MGTYHLRVMSTITGFITGGCDTILGGDVEDYTIEVIAPYNMTYQSMDAAQMSNICVQPGVH